MFQVGKLYNIRTMEWGEETSWSGRVVDYDGRLLKVVRRDEETIINTAASNYFMKVELARGQ